MQILYSYLSYNYRLVFFLLLVVILSEFQENPRRRHELQKRVHRSTCVEENTFLAARPSFYVIFCHFFRLLPVFRQLRFYVKKIFCHRKYCWNPPWKVSTTLKIFAITYYIKLISGYQISQLFLKYSLVFWHIKFWHT